MKPRLILAVFIIITLSYSCKKSGNTTPVVKPATTIDSTKKPGPVTQAGIYPHTEKFMGCMFMSLIFPECAEVADPGGNDTVGVVTLSVTYITADSVSFWSDKFAQYGTAPDSICIGVQGSINLNSNQYSTIPFSTTYHIQLIKDSIYVTYNGYGKYFGDYGPYSGMYKGKAILR